MAWTDPSKTTASDVDLTKAFSAADQNYADWAQYDSAAAKNKDHSGTWLENLFGTNKTADPGPAPLRSRAPLPGDYANQADYNAAVTKWDQTGRANEQAFAEGFDASNFSKVPLPLVEATRSDYVTLQDKMGSGIADLESDRQKYLEQADAFRAKGDAGADFGGADLAGFMGQIDQVTGAADKRAFDQIGEFGKTKQADLAALSANEAQVKADYKDTTASQVDLQRQGIAAQEQAGFQELDQMLAQAGISRDSSIATAGRMNVKLGTMSKVGQLVQSAAMKVNDVMLETGKYFAGLRTSLTQTFAGVEGQLRGNYMSTTADLAKAGIVAKEQAVAVNEGAKASYYGIEQNYVGMADTNRSKIIGLDLQRGTNKAAFLSSLYAMQESKETAEWNKMMQVVGTLVDIAGLGVQWKVGMAQADATRDANKPGALDWVNAFSPKVGLTAGVTKTV